MRVVTLLNTELNGEFMNWDLPGIEAVRSPNQSLVYSVQCRFIFITSNRNRIPLNVV